MKTIKRFFKNHQVEIQSIATTFVATFVLSLGAMFQTVDAETINQSLVIAAVVSAFRSALKASVGAIAKLF